MKRQGILYNFIITSGIIVLALSLYEFAAAADCVKAREFYKQGNQLVRHEERLQAFQKAVDLCPTYAEAHVNLADAYENLKNYDDAEAHYKEAIRLRGDFAVPYSGLGEVYLKTGRYGLAQEAFRKGLAVDPKDEQLQSGLNVTTERLGREKRLYTHDEISGCLLADRNFQLMCMCPGDHYSFLRRWVCMPCIFFGSGSACVNELGRRQLEHIAKALKSPGLIKKKWVIIGHADIIGDPERNLRLSERRCKAVKDYLVNRSGMNPQLLSVKSFGQKRPRATNDTDEGRKQNRRVEIVIDKSAE